MVEYVSHAQGQCDGGQTGKKAGETDAWILPVDVDAIEPLVVHELGQVRRKGLPVRNNGLSEDVVGGSLGGVGPAAKRHDALDVGQFLEGFPLGMRVFDDNLPSGRVNLGEAQWMWV